MSFPFPEFDRNGACLRPSGTTKATPRQSFSRIKRTSSLPKIQYKVHVGEHMFPPRISSRLAPRSSKWTSFHSDILFPSVFPVGSSIAPPWVWILSDMGYKMIYPWAFYSLDPPCRPSLVVKRLRKSGPRQRLARSLKMVSLITWDVQVMI